MPQHSRIARSLSVLVVLSGGSFAFAQGSSHADSPANLNYANLPLQFEPNQGQTDARVRFTSHGSGYSLFLTGDEAVLLLGKPAVRGNAAAESSPHETGVVRMLLAGARTDARITGADELPGKVNYFVGSDSSRWRTGVPTYAKVRYSEIYDGIDLVYYGNRRQLEYDFVLSPGAKPEKIQLRFGGARGLSVDAKGNLQIEAAGGTVAFRKPVAYQEVNGLRRSVESRFVLHADRSVGFALGAWDHARPLVIDPILEYATYLGGSTWDEAWAIAVDGSGNAYVAGGTESTDFPTTSSAYWPSKNSAAGTMTGFISKLNANGTALIYSTYLGGTVSTFGAPQATYVGAIALDSSGNIYAAGGTVATDFPITPGAMKTFNAPGNGFVTKLNASGSALLYSSTFGGNGGEYVAGIAVDKEGSAYVTGPTSSVDYPVTSGSYQPVRLSKNADTVYVSKLNPTATAFVYSTYLGGSTDDKSAAIAVDNSENAYITGSTGSSNFPVSSTAFQKTKASSAAQTTGFVTRLNAAGSALVYSTYLGGTVLDQPAGIAVDSSGQAFVTGATSSSDYPVTSGALSTVKVSDTTASTAFVTRLNASGSALTYSTFLGGSGRNSASSIAVDPSGNAFVTGTTASDDFPITPGAVQTTRSGATDAFVSKINSDGSSLLYSTFLGGTQPDYANAIAVGASGRAFVAGGTESADFPTTYGARQVTNNASDGVTAFVARLDLSSASGGAMGTTTSLSGSPNPATTGATVNFNATVSPAGGALAPSGNVVFTVDGKSTAPIALNSGGVATYSTTQLAVGTHTVTAAYGGAAGFAASSSLSLTETINPPQAAAPFFSPANGTYSSAQQVTIATSTPYAAIYYTVDGTTPTTASAKYAGPITVSSTTTFKAIAVAAGYSQSIISTATFAISLVGGAPAFYPAGGTYGQAKLVRLTSVTPNATIYYTTDGSTPTTSSTKYNQPIAVTATEVVKAIATAPGYATSPVSTAAYTLVATPQSVTGLATNLSSGSATLNATINNHNAAATVWFAWGTSGSAVTTSTAKISIGASPNAQPVSALLTGLASKTTYYFRPVISTLGGDTYGAVQTFTMP